MNTHWIVVLLALVAMATQADGPKIYPQEPQTRFMETTADIAFMGGGAGGGKSFALLAKPITHIGVSGYRAILLRRETTQIRGEGGLWDESRHLYAPFDGWAREQHLDWRFPSGAKISFGHMEHEDDCYKYDGTQFAFIGFDQLESFTAKQFWYMLSRNRTMCGVVPVMRATCNPVPKQNKVGGWLHVFLAGGGYIDPDSGYAVKEMSGVVRWFVNVNNKIIWGDWREDLTDQFGEDCQPLSFTFILALLKDNQAMVAKDPGYRGRLQNLRKVERERLLGADEDKGGNWNAHDAAGSYFKRQYFQVVKAAPTGLKVVRYWDRAATPEELATEQSSWTAGVKLGKDPGGNHYILHVERFHGSPGQVKTTVKNIATQDGTRVTVGIEQDPGQAGKAEAQDQARNLAGFTVKLNIVRESKGKRAEPVSSQAEAGNVYIVDGPWVENFLTEAENYDGTDKCTSDQIDALSGAFYLLNNAKAAGTWGS